MPRPTRRRAARGQALADKALNVEATSVPAGKLGSKVQPQEEAVGSLDEEMIEALLADLQAEGKQREPDFS
jgi:hypothetical protein